MRILTMLCTCCRQVEVTGTNCCPPCEEQIWQESPLGYERAKAATLKARERNKRPEARPGKQVAGQKQRALAYGVESTLTTKEWRDILDQSGGCCSYCSANVGIYRLVPDHVIPMHKGGPNTAANIAPACDRCNARKGARDKTDFTPTRVEPLGDDEVIVRAGKAYFRLYRSQVQALIDQLLPFAS